MTDYYPPKIMCIGSANCASYQNTKRNLERAGVEPGDMQERLCGRGELCFHYMDIRDGGSA